jgi:hypothetical protein
MQSSWKTEKGHLRRKSQHNSQIKYNRRLKSIVSSWSGGIPPLNHMAKIEKLHQYIVGERRFVKSARGNGDIYIGKLRIGDMRIRVIF